MLGEKILEYTKKKGISVRQFSIAVNIDHGQISRYIHGKAAPTERTHQKITRALPDFDELVNMDTSNGPPLHVVNEALRHALASEKNLNAILRSDLQSAEESIVRLQKQIEQLKQKQKSNKLN